MAQETSTSSWGEIANSWLNTAINGAIVVLDSKYKYQAAKEAAKVQSSIETSTAQTAAQEEKTNNTIRNVFWVVGGTLGLLLAYGVARKVLK